MTENGDDDYKIAEKFSLSKNDSDNETCKLDEKSDQKPVKNHCLIYGLVS